MPSSGEETPVASAGPNRSAAGLTGAHGDETVLIEQLRGLRLVASPGQVDANLFEGWSGAAVDASLVPILATPDFDYVARQFLGQPVSRESLQRLEQSTKMLLGLTGKPFSVVYWPEQDITAGYLQLVVMASRSTGEVEVQGARYFSSAHYLSLFRQTSADEINQQALRSDLDWINRNPFRQANVTASPGDEPGTTKLVLNVREKKPWRMFGGVNNTGTKTTGEDRIFAGVNLGNALGQGHLATLHYVTDSEMELIRSLSGSYSIDLPWRHIVAINGVTSRTRGKLAPPLSLKGASWQVGLSYTIPLAKAREGRMDHQLTFGTDFKSSDNNLEFSATPISDNITNVVQGWATYNGSWRDDWGVTSWNVKVTAAPGGVTDNNDDIFFTQSRAGASAAYVYAGVELQRRVDLRGPLAGWSWTGRGHWQGANDNLIGSEQMAAGGSSSVRGYDEGEAYGDEGLLFSHKLALPPISLAARLGQTETRDALRLFVFQDMARTSSVNPLPGERAVNLHSVGAGFRYQMGAGMGAQLAYGWQLRESGRSLTGRDQRVHVSLQLSY